jgi:hypothetical protein
LPPESIVDRQRQEPPVRNPFRRDLILLHPPAVYDFRTRPAFLGPLADAVPSTAMFEMYPVGLTSPRGVPRAQSLQRRDREPRVPHAAGQPLRRRGSCPVDVRTGLRDRPALAAPLTGALSIVEIVKRLHPGSRTLVGGLSASYYHDELIRYPFVDFVLGGSTEEPARQLLQALRESRPPNELIFELYYPAGDTSSSW